MWKPRRFWSEAPSWVIIRGECQFCSVTPCRTIYFSLTIFKHWHWSKTGRAEMATPAKKRGFHTKEERLLNRLNRKKNRSTFTRLCNKEIWSNCATSSRTAQQAERESIGTWCHFWLSGKDDESLLDDKNKALKRWCDNCRLDEEGRRPIVLAAQLGLHMFVHELLKVKCHYINEQIEVCFLLLEIFNVIGGSETAITLSQQI